MAAIKIRVLMLAACLAICGGVAAADDSCDGAPGQQAMNWCVWQKARAADAELNRIYRQYAAQLTPAGQKQLAEAERAWVLFRDSECGFEKSLYGKGSLGPQSEGECVYRLSHQRAVDLQGLDVDSH